MAFLTGFADQAVVLPVAVAILLGLLIMGQRRTALAWSGCVAGVLTVMLVLKLLGFACGRTAGLVSPSGHTAAACVVYGGLAALLAPRSRGGDALIAGVAGGVACLVGLTRLTLGAHTLAEVLTGAVVGLAGVFALHLTRPRQVTPWLLAVAITIMLTLHGQHLKAEERVERLAADIWPTYLCRHDR